jgi:hypothetical protein
MRQQVIVVITLRKKGIAPRARCRLFTPRGSPVSGGEDQAVAAVSEWSRRAKTQPSSGGWVRRLGV